MDQVINWLNRKEINFSEDRLHNDPTKKILFLEPGIEIWPVYQYLDQYHPKIKTRYDGPADRLILYEGVN